MPKPVPRVEIKEYLETKVGGFMGMGSKVSKFELTLDRNQYYIGDTCKINIACDNTDSTIAVKHFKIKLKRKVFATGLDRTTKK